MDMWNDDLPGGVALQKSFSTEEKPRPVFVTLEKKNGKQANGKPHTREITSRYKLGTTPTPRPSSSSARQTSPVPRTFVPQRAQSADRKRPSIPSSPSSRHLAPSSSPACPSTPSSKSSVSSPSSSRPSTPSSPPQRSTTPVRDSMTKRLTSTRRSLVGRAPDGLWPSIRSLSASFQSESSVTSSKSDKAVRKPSLDRSLKPSPNAVSEIRHLAPSSLPAWPSTPSSKSSASSSSSSRPSTPSSPPQRSTTPVRDSMTERLTSTRRSLVGRAPDGLRPSIRSLSASFQSESSVTSSKSDKAVRKPSPDRSLKPSPNAVSERKRTPLRGRNASDQSENSRPVENSHARAAEQRRWPSMIGGKVSSTVSLSKSLDLTDKVKTSVSLPISARGISPTRRVHLTDGPSKKPTSEAPRRKVTPVTSLAQTADSLPAKSAPLGMLRSRSPAHVTPLICAASPNKSFSALTSTSKGVKSPIRTRPSTSVSPLSSTFRGMHSPSRSRPSTPCSTSSSATTQVGVSSSVLNYIADVQKGKKKSNHMEDAHQLRLMCNRDLQWRFVNARADAAFSSQKLIAEDMIYNVWNITSELSDYVAVKRINVQNLRREMQLNTILEEQIAYLEEWSALEREYSTSLSGVIEALKASTLRLPVTDGARADVRALKNAISSAVDVMQVMGSSICCLLSRVEGTNCLVSELSEVASRERVLLDECRELLASTSAMQVQECSLRTNRIQLGQNPLAE